MGNHPHMAQQFRLVNYYNLPRLYSLVCIAVSDFVQISQRFPKRQAVDTDEKRAEDALARRWDRLLAEKASVSAQLLSTYSGIFAASEMEDDDTHLAVCIAVRDFVESAQRLPKRQGVDQDSGHDLMVQFDAIFGASDTAWELAMESGLATFLDEVSSLSSYFVGVFH